MDLKIGDRVIIKEPHNLAGEYGKIIETGDKIYGIRFYNAICGLHDCSGNCEDNHGYYVLEQYIEKYIKSNVIKAFQEMLNK